MKKIILFAFLLILLTGCGSNEFTIIGKTSGTLEGEKVLLLNNMGEMLDSCSVTDSSFAFIGSIDHQSVHYLYIHGKQIDVYVQNGAKIIADFTSLPITITDNGGLNDSFNAFMETINTANNDIMGKAQGLLDEGKTHPEVLDYITTDVEALLDIYQVSINENKDNIIGAKILSMVAHELYPKLDELDSIISEVKYASEIKELNDFRSHLYAAQATEEGKMFVDFTGIGINANSSKLSDYVGKGKYVLVNFWASWSSSSMTEIPHLVELQKNYGGEIFTVLGVNVWDQEEKFKAALKEENITYPQIFIPRGNKDNATELYNISGIPQIILFAPDGTILKRNLCGEEMKAIVAESLLRSE